MVQAVFSGNGCSQELRFKNKKRHGMKIQSPQPVAGFNLFAGKTMEFIIIINFNTVIFIIYNYIVVIKYLHLNFNL